MTDVPAADVLSTYGNPSLQQMLSQRGRPHQGLGKQKMVDALARDLYAPKRVQAALAELASTERAVLDQLILVDGEARTATLKATLERDGLLDAKQTLPQSAYDWANRGSPWEHGSRKLADVVARLGVLGLAFTAEPVGSGGFIVELRTPGRRLYIPAAILRQLPAVTAEPEQPAAPPATVHLADPAAALRDVYTLLSFARAEALPLTTRGLIAKRALVRLDESLRRPENAAQARTETELPRLTLHPRARRGPGPPGAAPRPAGAGQHRRGVSRAARGRAPRRAVRRLRPDESLVGAGAPAQTGGVARGAARLCAVAARGGAPPRAGRASRAARGRVADARPPGRSPAPARVSSSLLPRRGGRYAYGAGYRPNPYYGDNPLGLYVPGIVDEAKGWDAVEAQLIRLIATGPLHWLGLLDLGGEKGPPTALRVTADGARLLRGEPLPEETAAPNVVVQPNFQIFAFEPTGEDVLSSSIVWPSGCGREQAVEYRLTRESVYAAQRAGLDAADVLAFLDRVSRTPLPQNVRRSLEEWGALHERIVVRHGVPLLHAAAAADLDALYADSMLGTLLGRRLSPTAALVPRAADLPRLAEALLAAGHLPALSEGAEDVPSAALTVDAAGRVTFRQRLPSVHVLRAVEPFLDTAPDGARTSPPRACAAPRSAA